jgi:hypothetical protein
MDKFKYILISALFISLFSGTLEAQYFGKNKVQHKTFEWQFLQSEHFDIYFTKGGEEIAAFTARVAEESYIQLSKDLKYELVDRIKMLVYNSHNDFGQTNVDLRPPEESVGGFTEFFKNRVVIPYEGEWEKFRHVIHHELTHAVMLQMVYGAGSQSIITGLTQFQMPLWFIEGLAEHQSRGWDIESDMFMRDATVNGYVPDIPYLYGFMAYKGGQSVLRYISETYGDEKVGELINKMKMNKNVTRGFKESIGIDLEELTKRWHLDLKRQYWPDITNRKEPEEIAKKITDHRKWRNFVNTSPVMSNKGDKIAFLSDKDNYFDIFIASSIDGKIIKKVVRGQRSGNLEELNWLRGRGIDWSPDDKQLVFSAKAGAEHQIHIVDIKSEKIVQSIETGLESIYNSSWSPNGEEIAFMGVFHGQADIYIYNLKDQEMRPVTNDMFSNVEPSWSPDGSKIIFASDRNDFLYDVPDNFTPEQLDMQDYDIFEINTDGTGLRKIVDTEFVDRSPIYSPAGDYIAFQSERAGVSNIYVKSLETGDEWPITNVITGAFFPTWGGSANRLAFAAFYYAGYDIYMMKNPLDIQKGDIVVEETSYVKNLRQQEQELLAAEGRSDLAQGAGAPKSKEDSEYKNFVFDEEFADGNIDFEERKVFLDSSDYYLPTGDFKIKDYEIQFSTDMVYGAVGYDQFFGTQGYTNIMLSDVLGDHRLNLALNLYGDFKNADYAFTYYYLKNRLDVGGGAYHNAYFFYSNNLGWVRDRNYGLSLLASNPFDRYKRISAGLSLMGINRTYMDWPDEIIDDAIERGALSPRNRFFALGNLTYTKDTTVWGYTGPIAGTRWGVGLTGSPKIGENGIEFTTVRGDWRKYFLFGKDYIFGLRFSGGASYGKHPQKFFLGGTSNWINYRYNGGLRIDRIEEIYFSSFEMPLRGLGYYADEGNRFFMSNIEFRFPFVRYLQTGFPPMLFSNIGGAVFMDTGVAWDDDQKLKLFSRSPSKDEDVVTLFKDSPNGLVRTQHFLATIGYGVRINLGIFLMRIDFAWPTDFYSTSKDMHVLWSLGADF